MAANFEPEQQERPTAHALLEIAIRIAQHGDKIEARQLLRSYLEDHPQDERAWAWYVDTFPDDQKRLRILKTYLKYHPESDFAQQAAASLRRRLRRGESPDKIADRPVPFQEPSTGWPPALSPDVTSANMQDPSLRAENRLSERQATPARKTDETRLLILAVSIILITIILAVAWSLLH